jgi:hypothetical protein
MNFKCGRKKLWIHSETLMTENHCQDIRFPGKNFKTGPSEYEV